MAVSAQSPFSCLTRSLCAADAPAVAELLAAVHAQAPTEVSAPTIHEPANDERSGYRRTLVAEADGDLIGVGTIWDYWLHPARWRLALHVHPNARRRGVGTALLEQLTSMIPSRDVRPLQAATSAGNTAGRQFLHRSGFDLLMRTRLGTVDPSIAIAAIRPEIDDATERATRTGYRIATLADESIATSWTDELADLHAEIYRLGHDWNPPASITNADARRLFMDEDELIPEAFYVGLIDDRPGAVASLRRGETLDKLDLGWVGVAARHQDYRDEFAVALVGRCLTYSAERHETLSVEVDETDGPLWDLINKLPVALEPDWLTFARSMPSP